LGGANYYRLKVNDLDGSYHYSNIILVQSSRQSRLRIYPSVTSGELTVENAVRFEIINASGQIVSQSVGHLANSQHLNLNLPTGIYFVKGVDTEGGIFSKKIVKQ
jgi:hypothetical protein